MKKYKKIIMVSIILVVTIAVLLIGKTLLLQFKGFETCKLLGGSVYTVDTPYAGARECHLDDESYNEADNWDHSYSQYYFSNAGVTNTDLELFDSYYSKSQLPVIEDSTSLCHGLYVSSDFSALTPKYATAKLIEIKKDFGYTLVFRGKSTTGNIVIPMSSDESKTYKVGSYYKIDMMNICRNLFMMADNMYPSKIRDTFIKPIIVTGGSQASSNNFNSSNYSTTVDQSLINEGIAYVKQYFIELTKQDFPNTDVKLTMEKYACTYTKPAKDDNYLYINLTCIGKSYKSDGQATDNPLTNFSENPTRLKYELKDGKYSIIDMNQPISPMLYRDVFPIQYIEYLK